MLYTQYNMREFEIKQIRWNNKILFSGVFGYGVGFSNQTEMIIPELEKLGYDIYIDDWNRGSSDITNPHLKALYEKYESCKNIINFEEYPHVVNWIMEGFGEARGKYKVGGCFIESTKLRKKYVDIVNNMDYLFTSCEYNRKIEIDSGVIKPIFIVPPYTDADTFCYKERNHKETPFTFLHVGVIQERKNTEQLIIGYINAFPDNGKTKLIIKSNHSGVVRYLAERTKNRKDIEYIYTNENPLSLQQMKELYYSADCYINISHGEGTGLPDLEAMSTGLPVIGSNWDARQTFLDNDVGWMINISHFGNAYNLVLDEECGVWAHYDIYDYINKLRYVYEHQEEAKQKGKIASERIKNNFTIEKAVVGYDAIFMDVYNKKRNNNV